MQIHTESDYSTDVKRENEEAVTDDGSYFQGQCLAYFKIYNILAFGFVPALFQKS